MRRFAAAVVGGIAMAAGAAAAGEVTLVAMDPGGVAGRVEAPVSASVDLAKLFGSGVDPRRLRLVEVVAAAQPKSVPVPVQFEPGPNQPLRGTLWWPMPPGAQGPRRFRLSLGAEKAPAALIARVDTVRKRVDVTEGDLPVLRYNHGTVPPPPEIVAQFERGREHPLRYARGDYIHPLYGPDAQALTDDYSLNHPHHRGVSWAWPVVRYQGEVRDLWAVRVLPSGPGGVWARPVALRRVEAGPVLAVIDAENAWKWGDAEPIVREEVLIRAFRSRRRCRVVDVEVRLTALVDAVSIGGRPKATYGGFAVRTFPEFSGRKIAMHVEPPGSGPRRAWFHLAGVFPGAKGPAGLLLLEHVANPGYPSYPNPDGLKGIPGQYPAWRSVLPCFPGDREVPLAKGRPLVLKHRLWIHPATADEATLGDVWASYARPPQVQLTEEEP